MLFRRGNNTALACAKVPPFSALYFRMAFSLRYASHSFENAVCFSWQFGQQRSALQPSSSWPLLHRGQTADLRQFCFVCPKRWHLKHRMGFGTNGLTSSSRYAIFREVGGLGESKVRTQVFVKMSFPSRRILMRRAWVTLSISCTISSSVQPSRSRLFTTPLELFRVLWA